MRWLFFILPLAFGLQQCRPKPIEGCTNSAATNFNPIATKSDYSCCFENIVDEDVNVNGRDQFNNNFAVFQFHQKRTNRKKEMYATCRSNDECQTTLIIRNITSRTVQFGYNIIFNHNAVTWNYQNIATIPPQSTLNVGLISAHCDALSLGTIQIFPTGNGIIYL